MKVRVKVRVGVIGEGEGMTLSTGSEGPDLQEDEDFA